LESARSVRQDCFPQVKFRAKTAGWRPPLLELLAKSRATPRALSEVTLRVRLQANYRKKVMPLVQQPAKPQRLEPRD
jgi:hypothetical protein